MVVLKMLNLQYTFIIFLHSYPILCSFPFFSSLDYLSSKQPLGPVMVLSGTHRDVLANILQKLCGQMCPTPPRQEVFSECVLNASRGSFTHAFSTDRLRSHQPGHVLIPSVNGVNLRIKCNFQMLYIKCTRLVFPTDCRQTVHLLELLWDSEKGEGEGEAECKLYTALVLSSVLMRKKQLHSQPLF